MDEEKIEDPKPDVVGQNVADTIFELQSKYEEEHTARIEAERINAELTKVIRTMSVQRADEPKEVEKPKTLDEAIDDLF